MAEQRQDLEVEEADHIYLLMKEDYRISRNVRLAWFLSRLNQVVCPASKPHLLSSENELDLLSVLPKGWRSDVFSPAPPCRLVASTRVTFLARRYRFVIELDLSPSTGIVDDGTGEMIFDEVFHALSRCLAGLAQPFRVPGTDQLFKPKIFITILAYTSIIGLAAHQVLVQGCQLDQIDLDGFLLHIYQQLKALESNIADVLHQQHEQQAASSRNPDQPPHRKPGVSMVTADMGLVSMVRQGILALQLLPPNSSAGVIIITDGVTSVPDVAVCETLLNQLRSGTVACSFVQVGGAYSYDCSFGYVPNVELMKFVSLATFGSYLPSCPDVDVAASGEMNMYHKAFLTYSFLKTPESLNTVSQHKLFNEHLVSASGNPALVVRRKKHTEKEVHAHLVSVVSVRLREGYTVREIGFTKGGTQLEVKLVLLWKHNMHIEYMAAAPWPLEAAARCTRVEVTMEGSYDILHDISCTQRKPITSPYRTAVIRRFWTTLQSINQTDQMLVHLQSFNSAPENYQIPESTKNGVPLFYIPPGSSTPVLSLQHSGAKDSSQSQFAAYWKPILSMDATFWQRWLHMHRIAIILEHDMPVPKHLHTAGNNGRYSTIQCRISHSALTSLLRDCSSFVLVEGYSYVKLISSSSDQTPSSFYLVRLISKTPCMVLRLGFPIGTPAHVRNKIVDELREQILKLRFPHRVQSKEATPKTKRKASGQPSPSKSPSITAAKPALSDRPCVVVLNKPLEKLLIRYEKLPLDFRTPFIFNLENFPAPSGGAAALSAAASRTASSTLASLSRYFLHRRWVWAVPSSPAPAVATQAAAHVLSTLSEIRLSEGFHFAASAEGIINMVTELPMTATPGDSEREHHLCTVQYILFPPHCTSTKDSFSTDEDDGGDGEASDGDGELSLVTEVWVEPQSGTVAEQHRHLGGLCYDQIPNAMFPRDLSCLSTMMTLESLIQMCHFKEQSCSLAPPRGKVTTDEPRPDDSIHTVPFQFDLIQLLPRCQQVELLFVTLCLASENAPSPSNELLLALFHGSVENDLSNREVPLADSEHTAFVRHVLERERSGQAPPPPFLLPAIGEDTMTSFHTTGSSKEVTGSTSTLQSFSDTDLTDKDISDCLAPRWRCYAKSVSSQQLLLTFLPMNFSDVTSLMASRSEVEPNMQAFNNMSDGSPPVEGTSGVQTSEARGAELPVYVYSCSLEHVKEQLVQPCASCPTRDVFFRSLSQDRSGPSPWSDLLAPPLKHKEPANHCSLLQEHFHHSYVKGVYRSLQRGLAVASQDVLVATDYCEESLQELDITNFLHALCGHVRHFRERRHRRDAAATGTASFDIRDDDGLMTMSEMDGVLDVNDVVKSEDELQLSLQQQPRCEVYPDLHRIIQDKFSAILSQYFQSVPSNPHYHFYCPPSAKKEESEDGERERRTSEELLSEAEQATEDESTSGCCVLTESDTDLLVEYEEHPAATHRDSDESQSRSRSPSDSNTVNQDQDSFSILDGEAESLPGAELQLDMPPMFLHITCSVNVKNCHGSTPITTLPTCLGELIGCLENAESFRSADMNELSVTLDVFVLTLPLEIEVVNDFHHNRYASESSVSLNRSPGQPSSYRSDEELMAVLECLRGTGGDGVSGDPLAKLPLPHKFAILATMDEIRWLLEDEIVSALRRSRIIDATTLRKVAEHVVRSAGRPHCRCEDVPLQFVFGSERSLEKFKEEFRHMSFPGYVLNGVREGFYYVSLSRLHRQRIHAPKYPQKYPMESSRYPTEFSRYPTESSKYPMESSRYPMVTPDETMFETEGQEVVTQNPDNPSEDPESGVPDAISQTRTGSAAESGSPTKTPSSTCLVEPLQTASHGGVKLRPSRIQSVVSSQGSLDSDMQGYDGGSSDSECESTMPDEVEWQSPLMPDFWLIIEIHQDRVKVYSHSRCFSEEKETRGEEEKKEEEEDEYLHLHQTFVRRIGEICRVVNQRMLLQDLHDSHVCNSLLVAESDDDIWKNEPLYRQRLNTSDDYVADDSYAARDYLAATMQFIPGHFACDVVWTTTIHIHPRLKMAANMGVSRAMQALRSVLNSFCVVNRKNMFVYQERSTKSVFYLRLCETSLTGKYSDVDGNLHTARSVALGRSQEPSDDLMGSRASQEETRDHLDETRDPPDGSRATPDGSKAPQDGTIEPSDGSRPPQDGSRPSQDGSRPLQEGSRPPQSSSRPPQDGSRPPGPVDKHILLLVHGVGDAGPEITDELVKVLRKRLDETTLDIITVMLVRNCKLTPADVEFIQPSGSPATEIMTFALPPWCHGRLAAVSHYLRQNLLIFLHLPKYTDSNTAHHFKHYLHLSSDLLDGDVYLYNKPGGQGTGGKGVACVTLSFVDAAGRPLPVPTPDCGAPRRLECCGAPLHPEHFQELTAVVAMETSGAAASDLCVRFDIWEQGNISPLQLSDKLQGALRHALADAVMELRILPNPLCVAATRGQSDEASVSPAPDVRDAKDSNRQRSAYKGAASGGGGNPESTTPTGKTRRSFWDILSKPDSSELGSPKTTDDIVQERGDEGRAARRRHKTESLKQQWSQDRTLDLDHTTRKATFQLEEGDTGTLNPVYQDSCRSWISFMAKLGCPSIQFTSCQLSSHFLVPSILSELVNLVASLAGDTAVKVFEKTRRSSGDAFVPTSLGPSATPPPLSSRSFILIGRNFHQWRCSAEPDDGTDEESMAAMNRFTPHKGFQRFEALEPSDGAAVAPLAETFGPRQRFLLVSIRDKEVALYSYNWSLDLGAALNRDLVQLVKWQNARSHVVHCLFHQKMGLFHHYCFSDAPAHEGDSKLDPNPFLGPAMEPDALLRSAVPPPPSKDPGRLLVASTRSLAPLHFPSELLPFDEALRDVTGDAAGRHFNDGAGRHGNDVVTRQGGQLLEIKAAERRELEKQMKIENLFVTWQQRSAQSNMPISAADLETLKRSSRLVHYCATPLLFDPAFRKQIQEEQLVQPPAKKRHRSSDSTASGRDRSYSSDSGGDTLPGRLKEEAWLVEISGSFLQQYVQYLQSLGFILVQLRPPSPARSVARARAAMLSSMSTEGRMSFSYVKQKSDDSSPKMTVSGSTAYHLQRALPGGIVLMELAFQGCYFCVKQYALECSRIPMGQTVNSQATPLLAKPRCKPFPDAAPPVSDCALSMLFTEECDKVRDLMHVHSFSYDFHLRVAHQHLAGCHMTLRQGYQLTDFLDDFIAQHPDIPKFGRNHVFQGSLSVPTATITAHQLYNYVTDHAGSYGMKPLRMSRAAASADSRKSLPELHEYALVAVWNSSGSYKDLEGLNHHDDFDVSLVVCHNAAPFEEQSDLERHLLRLGFYVIMTSQRELFPHLTADMRRFKKLPQIHRDPGEPAGLPPLPDRHDDDDTSWDETPSDTPSSPSDGNEFYPLAGGGAELRDPLYAATPLFPLLNNEVAVARRQIQASVEQAMGHCRRDNLWRRLFHGEHALDKLKLARLSLGELEELLGAVHSCSIADIDPQLDGFLTMNPTWYQSLIKVLLSRFPQSCRHFDDGGVQYLAVLNQKFTDCFVLVFLDSQAGKTSLKVVFREPLPPPPPPGGGPPPQLVSMYHHLESVINTACFTLWTGLL